MGNRDNRGFSLVEMLVSMVLFLTVTSMIFTIFILSHRSASHEKSVTDTQQRVRSSLELMSRQMKKAVRINTALNATPTRSSIDFTALEEMGFADTSAETTRTLADGTKSWDEEIWKGSEVTIVSGTGEGQTRTIIYNDSSSLLVDPAWDTTPDRTSLYQILVDQKFYVDDVTYETPTLVYSRSAWDPGTGTTTMNDQPYARNVTSLSLKGFDLAGTETTAAADIVSLELQVTSMTENPGSDRESPYPSYTTESHVLLRNKE